MRGNRPWTLETGRGFARRARDGTVADLGVECGTWQVRHLIIDTGTCLQGVQLRLPTDAVATLDREERQLTTAMTCADLQEDAFHRIAEEEGEEEDGT